MKKLFFLLLFVSHISFAATRYWVGGGSAANWNSTGPTNWSATSGGSNNASVPGSTDDVIFDGAGANGNTNSNINATITILSLTITSGYTATMNHLAVLTIAGNMTLSTGYTITGTAAITISATSTITTNGKTWPNSLNFSNTGTFTLGSLLTVGGTLTVNAGVAATFAGAFGFTVTNLTFAAATALTMTLVNGITYTVTGAFTANSSRVGAILLITSDHPTLKANLTVQPGATMSAYANFTRIDASGGRTISTWNGTVTDCTNIVSYVELPMVTSFF